MFNESTLFNESTFVSTISNHSLQKSEEVYGTVSYGYALGFFESSIKHALRDLNLTNKQRKILLAHLESLK